MDDVQRLQKLADAEKKHNEDLAAKGELEPLKGGSKRKQGSIFLQGKRIRMNALAMLINIFVPWAFFCTGYMVTGFYLMYKYPAVAVSILVVMFLFWLLCAYTAYKQRYDNPDPTWFTYFALALICGLVAGSVLGYQGMMTYMAPYYDVSGMQIAGMAAGSFGLSGGMLSGGNGVDLSVANSLSLMDAGMVKFAPGTELAKTLTGHFKYKQLYCVAPLTGPNGVTSHLTYDIWVVGQNCCNIHASDFRCGAWDKNLSQVIATRITDDDSLKYFYLAAQQAASINHIEVKRPLFFFQGSNFLNLNFGGLTGSTGSTSGSGSGSGSGSASASGSLSASGSGSGSSGSLSFSQSPMEGLKTLAYDNFIFWCTVALVFFSFGVCMAAAKFSFLGRGMFTDFLQSPEWRQGNKQPANRQPEDEHVHTYSA